MSNPRSPNGANIATAILAYETSKEADRQRMAGHHLKVRIGGVNVQVSDLGVWTSHRELRRMARRLARAFIELEDRIGHGAVGSRIDATLIAQKNALITQQTADIRKLENELVVAKRAPRIVDRAAEMKLREDFAKQTTAFDDVTKDYQRLRARQDEDRTHESKLQGTIRGLETKVEELAQSEGALTTDRDTIRRELNKSRSSEAELAEEGDRLREVVRGLIKEIEATRAPGE